MQQYLATTRYTSKDNIMALNSSLPKDASEYSQATVAEKLQFWTTTITETTKKSLLGTSQLTFNSKDLHLKFTVNGEFPLCINGVLEHLQKSSKIVPVDHYKPKGMLNATACLIYSPMKWLVSAPQDFIGKNQQYIVVEIIKVNLFLY